MLLAKERQTVVDYLRKLSSSNLTYGTSGNISVFDRTSELLAISPSSMDYALVNAEDVVVCDLKGNVVDGLRHPSSELALHSIFYRNRSDINAIVHCHSMYSTVFATLEEPILAMTYSIGAAGQSYIPCAPYATFGTEELAEVTYKHCLGKAVLMSHHGLLTCGADLKEAYSIAYNIEFVAELQYRARCIGNPQPLSSKQMDDYFAKLKSFMEELGNKHSGY
jgi:L-fuculose-phosphate aldolase